MKFPRLIGKPKHRRAIWAISASIAAPVLGFVNANAQTPPASLSAIARGSGFTVCQKEIDLVDRNLFSNSDYTVRAFVAEKNANARPWSAIIDARRVTGGVLTRSLTHVTVTPAVGVGSASCSVSYEQTQYHDLRCELVQQQMAPNAKPASGTSFGALTLDLHRNMTLTVIPAGSAQCISVLKEVLY